MQKKQVKPETKSIVDDFETREAVVWLKGTTPLLYASLSKAIKLSLLGFKRDRSISDRTVCEPYSPLADYRDSVHTGDGSGPTRLTLPSHAFRHAFAQVTRHLNTGVTMLQMKQLLWLPGDNVSVYGVPELLMGVEKRHKEHVTLCANAIVPQWCCKLSVRYVYPNLSDVAITEIIARAGSGVGVGRTYRADVRDYGRFCISDEKRVAKIVKAGCIKQQDAALETPAMYDEDTEQLFSAHQVIAAKRDKKRKKQ